MTTPCKYCGDPENVVTRSPRKNVDGTLTEVFYCTKCKKKFSMPQNAEKIEYTEEVDNIRIVAASPRLKTLDDIIKHFEIDTDVWRIERFRVKTSEGYRKDRSVEWDVEDQKVIHGKVRDSGKMLVVPLTHTETVFTRKTMDDISVVDITRVLRDIEPAKVIPVKPKQYSLEGKLLEIVFADPHFAREYADDQAEDTTTKIEKTVNEIVSRAQGQKLKEIILAPVGDIFDVDGKNRQTTAGTQQHTTMKPHAMFRYGVERMIWFIEQLRRLAPVKYVFVPGNHDYFASFCLALTLQKNYQNYKDVSFIINDDSKFSWYVYGLNLIAWTHGDIPKSNQFSWLPTKASQEWGATKFREVHSGHVNVQTVFEGTGQVVRYLSSIADASLWENGMGYSGNQKATSAFIWDSKQGMQAQWWINV